MTINIIHVSSNVVKISFNMVIATDPGVVTFKRL